MNEKKTIISRQDYDTKIVGNAAILSVYLTCRRQWWLGGVIVTGTEGSINKIKRAIHAEKIENVKPWTFNTSATI